MGRGSREKSDRSGNTTGAPGDRLAVHGRGHGLGILSSSEPDDQSELEDAMVRRRRLFGAAGVEPKRLQDEPSASAEEHPDYDDPPGQPWPPDDGHDRGYN